MLLDETSQKKGSKNDQITFAILPPPPPKIVILLTFSDFYVILVFPRQKYEISTSREFVNCEAWYVCLQTHTLSTGRQHRLDRQVIGTRKTNK